MLKNSLLMLSLIATTAATAQTQLHSFSILPKPVTAKEKMHRKFVMHMLLHNPAAAAKTTVLHERVIGQAESDGTDADSMALNYSGTRSSTYDYNEMDYYVDNPYDGSPMFNGYNGHFNTPQVFYDTVQYYSTDSAGMPLTDMYMANYDGSNNLSFYKDSMIQFGALYEYNTFDAQNNISRNVKVQYVNSTASFDTLNITEYTYDNQHRIISDSDYSFNSMWASTMKYTYSYDNAGNMSDVYGFVWNGTSWDSSEHYANTFYSNNKVQTILHDYYNAGSWQPETKDTFGYTTGVDFNTYWSSYSYNNSNWNNDFVLAKHLNAQNLPDTLYATDMSSMEIALVSYDSYNNPTHLRIFDMSNMTDPTNWVNYYYETYNVSVPNVPIADDFKVYPNPANSTVYISSQKNAGQQLTARLINNLGQTVQQVSFKVNGTYSFSLNNIQPGMYWITVQDEKGNNLHKQAIVKQ